MTWREKLQEENPNLACGLGGGFGCPHMHFDEAEKPSWCTCSTEDCKRCWNREVPKAAQETVSELERQMIKRALNTVYGALTPKPTVKSCGTCKYLEKMTNMEPCASCISVGCDSTNWVSKDDNNLGYDPNDISTWYPKSMIIPGRRNGKTYDMQRLLNRMITAGDPVAVVRKQHHDGLSAQLFAIDEMHSYKPKERKTDMPTSNDWFPHGVTVRNGGTMTILPAALPEIEDVIFNPPATIVFWKDKTKTVVKANNEEYDPEKGLAMAMIKKLYGNKGNYCNKLKKWTEKYHGYTPAEKAEKRDKQIREKLAYAEVMLDSIINDKSKLTKADLRALAKDTRKLIGEALEDL